MLMVELSEEDQKLLERAKILKAALQRVRERVPHDAPFSGMIGPLGEGLSWIAWAVLHGQTVDFAEPENKGEVSEDLQEHWAYELKQVFPDRDDPVWQFICFDTFDDPFREDKLLEECEKEDREADGDPPE